MPEITTSSTVPYYSPAYDYNGFSRLYTAYWQVLLNESYYYLKDYSMAEEIVQQLFTDLYTKDILVKDITYLSSYLKRAVKNRIYNYMLKNKRYNHHLKVLYNKTNDIKYNPVDNAMDMRDIKNEISFYLSKLKEPCRTVFVLNREHHLTIKEIALKLNRPEDTVTKQLSRAVRYLHKCLYNTSK